jgi:RNA polymerase sigma-70 factor (ECF subfamily)
LEFDNAHKTHVFDVYGFLAYRSRSRETAEDLTQETFERALKAWSRFDPQRSDARTWLLAIARNVYLDSRRRSKARPESPAPASVIDAAGGSEEGPGRYDPDPDLARALGSLSRREREAIALRFGGDLKVAGVAGVMGITTANAQQILSRALKRLRSLLEGSSLSG